MNEVKHTSIYLSGDLKEKVEAIKKLYGINASEVFRLAVILMYGMERKRGNIG